MSKHEHLVLSYLMPGSTMDATGSICKQAWGLQRLDIQACWQRGLTGAGVRVGHLDTGVDGSHFALRRRVVEFMEFDREGYPVPGAPPRDSDNHGTHIAGIICGAECDGLRIGVAPNARLCSAMVIEGGKSLVRILAGLDWILDCNVRVLCISLGLRMYHPLFEIILSRIKQAGIFVVAPAGNRGAGFSCSPASYPGVIAVGAINAKDRVARFSGSQLFDRASDSLKPNLVAPGTDIPSAKSGGGLQIRSGTSMAAAHVAGVASLLFQAKASATATEVEEAILATCTPLPDSSERRYGRGLINPAKALDAILATGRR